MTEDKPIYNLIKDNIIFISVPLCALISTIKFDSSYKIIGLALFVSAFCVIYRLYAKVANHNNSRINNGIMTEFLSVSGFIITICLGLFAEVSIVRWFFLIGTILAVTFTDILSSLLSSFAYVLIVTVFTNTTPEFVANSFLTAVILIILTRYYSDFLSVVYSIITLLSFEVAFFVIMNGLRTDQIITVPHIIDVLIISGCIFLGWILNKITVKNIILKDINSEVITNSVGEQIVKDKISYQKDYSYLLSKDVDVYKKMVENEKLFNIAERNSRFVKEIIELLGGQVSLAKTGAFYAECGRLISNNYIIEGLVLAKDNNFPNEVTAFIKEHNFKLGYPKSRETAITMIVCKFSTTIFYLENKGIKRSLTQIVDGVMDSCLMSGRLDASGLSLNEYKFIKDYLMEEARTSYDYFSGE